MASVQGIYVALFGRPADPAGLNFFNGDTSSGADLSNIGGLTGSAEFQSRFANMSNEQIINSIYQSLFGRDGDRAGIDFYLGEIAKGHLNIPNVAIAILDGAQGDDAKIAAAKIAAANLFTTHLDLPTEQTAYGPGNSSGVAYAASVGRSYLSGVTATGATSDQADAAILKLFLNQGQAPGGDDGSSNGGGGAPTNNVTLYDNHGAVIAASETLNPMITGEGDATNPVWTNATTGDTVVVTGLNHVIDNLPYELSWIVNQPIPADGYDPQPIKDLINQAFQPNGYIDIGGFHLLPPDNLFLNVPSWAHPDAATLPTVMNGTGNNDIMLFVENSAGVHTANGGDGQDIIISVSSDAIANIFQPQNADKLTVLADEFPAVGTHTLSGGNGDDVILSIGGENNHINGDVGNDVIVSLGASVDIIDGGAGDDLIFAGPDGPHAMLMLKASAALDGPSEPAFFGDFADGNHITGGTGSDTFLYLAQNVLDSKDLNSIDQIDVSSLVGNGNNEITDFTTGQDKIAIVGDPNVYFPTPTSEVDGSVTLNYGEGTAALGFDSAHTAALEWLSARDDSHGENVVNAYFVAPVAAQSAVADNGDAQPNAGYLFVDDNNDGVFDFTVQLDGAVTLASFDAHDIQILDASGLLNNIGIINSIPSMGMAA